MLLKESCNHVISVVTRIVQSCDQ